MLNFEITRPVTVVKWNGSISLHHALELHWITFTQSVSHFEIWQLINLFCKISQTLKLLYCVFKCYWQRIPCQLTIPGPFKTQLFFFFFKLFQCDFLLHLMLPFSWNPTLYTLILLPQKHFRACIWDGCRIFQYVLLWTEPINPFALCIKDC